MPYRSQLLSSAGQLWEIIKILVNAILEKDGTDDDVLRLKTLAPQVAELVISARPKVEQPAAQTAPEEPAPVLEEKVEDLGWVVLDPTVSFEDRVKRGKYKGGVHRNITAKNSRLKRKVRRFIVLYDPQGEVSTEEMKRRIRANGDIPCDLDDGLGIGETFPERQVANPLPLLDESAFCLVGNVFECAPVLSGWGGGRELRLSQLAGDWISDFRFPAVRKEEYLDT